MTIPEWQRAFAEAVRTNEKFTLSRGWTEQDRLLSISRQLADVTGGIQKEQGIYPHPNEVYNDPNHRIAALIADILILCDTRNLDVEVELEKVLQWYKKENGEFSK